MTDFTDDNGNELSFDDILNNAQVEQANRLAGDKEWTTPITLHIKSIIEAFALGICQSYTYYNGWQLPPNYETVINRMAELLQEEFKNKMIGLECVEVSLLKLRGVYNRLAMSIPDYCAWNEMEGDGVTSRFDITPDKPSFIDLYCPPHNAVLYLRNCERDNKRSDEEFERKYGELE